MRANTMHYLAAVLGAPVSRTDDGGTTSVTILARTRPGDAGTSGPKAEVAAR
ncbi:hypothetical protein [Microtetraspora glauca]|uniref:Uncharacterized protein n=1 Tax=Microtetraspora glauca TaxID=1996 RepID=A0ABV3GCM0_MICGL